MVDEVNGKKLVLSFGKLMRLMELDAKSTNDLKSLHIKEHDTRPSVMVFDSNANLYYLFLSWHQQELSLRPSFLIIRQSNAENAINVEEWQPVIIGPLA